MGAACLKFNTPVTGGNVSFYNQHPEGAVYPTPTIGMVGLLEDTSRKMTMFFKHPGDLIFLVGKSRNDINSSAYLYSLHDVEYSPAPYFDLDEEYILQKKLLACIQKGFVESAHDVAEGGLFVTLAESGFHRELGFSVNAQDKSIRGDAYWFGESQSRVVVTIKNEQLAAFKNAMEGIPLEKLGEVTTSVVQVDGEKWGNIREWKYEYETAIEKEMKSIVEA
ncbi:MAG TPA: AIR synthase-related protein [Puia sp.]|nr:AIR synthase-related protein [Puia sp.]